MRNLRKIESEVVWTAGAGILTAILCWCLLAGSQDFFRDDAQAFYLPGYLDMVRAFHEGSFPLVTPSSWIGGRLGGEYQYGMFSVFHWVVVLTVFHLGLSLRHMALAIVLSYIAVYGAGAFRLARVMGIRRPNALIVSFAAALNGWVLYWGGYTWIAFLASYAWLPWVWWGLLVAKKRRFGVWRFLPAGLSIYLLLTAAHPYGDMVMAVIIAWVLVQTVFAHRRVQRAWQIAVSGGFGLAIRLFFNRNLAAKLWPIGLACFLGVTLASPAILLLAETFSESTRCKQGLSQGDHFRWTVPIASAPGVVLPMFTTTWYSWVDRRERDCFELYCGFVPAVAFLAIFWRARFRFVRRHAWECCFLVITLLLCTYGIIGSFRWPFRWLPLFHLQLGVLGAFAVQEWPHERSSARKGLVPAFSTTLGCWGLLFVTLALGWAILESPSVFRFDNTTPVHVLSGAALMAGICLIWAIGEWLARRSPRFQDWVPVGMMAIALVLPWQFCTSQNSTLQWTIDHRVLEPGLLDKDRLYFAFLFAEKDTNGENDADGVVRRFGNTPLYAGVKFINGYSPMPNDLHGKILHYEWMGCGYIRPKNAKYMIRNETGPDGLLQLLGVDGIVLGRNYVHYTEELEKRGWTVVSETPYEAILHRDGPKLPVIRPVDEFRSVGNAKGIVSGITERGSTPAPALLLADKNHPAGTATLCEPVKVSDIQESRLSVRCRVENPSLRREGFVVCSRAWYPGYQATLNGKPVDACAVNSIQAGISIPPGAKGELVLRYDPPLLQYGLSLAIFGPCVAIVGPWWFVKKKNILM
jgi:hypothetical protein